jgi:integral membrane protein (TIGR01906 family)
MKKLAAVGLVLITLVVPFFLIMSSIRLLLIPYIYVDVEYRLPGFPADTYGFTQADRLKWSHVSIDYLLNDQPISWLADQHLPDGTSLYNDRELGHMRDVKTLIQSMFVAWWILLAILVGAGLLAWWLKGARRYFRALSNGGWLTIILVITILVFTALNFDWLFTEFHRLFFTGDTWLFLFSDTLIRLFPIQFWQDGFIAMGGATIIFALLFGFFGRRLSQ